MAAGVAPQVVLKATHRKALEVCSLEDLTAHAVDAGEVRRVHSCVSMIESWILPLKRCSMQPAALRGLNSHHVSRLDHRRRARRRAGRRRSCDESEQVSRVLI